MSEKSFYASLTGYLKGVLHDSMRIAPYPLRTSCSISSSSSSFSFDKSQRLYHVYDPESNFISHGSWLQRRDSLSSQRAVYPPVLLARDSYSRLRSLGSMPVLDEDATLKSMHVMNWSSSNPIITTSALIAPLDYSQPSRMPLTSSSISVSRHFPLSPMRRASQPEISIDLLAKTLGPSPLSREQPVIRHVPLSEDPEIRKLSEGGGPNDSNSNDDTRCFIGPAGKILLNGRCIRRKVFPDVNRSITSSNIPPLPALPNRAPANSAIRRALIPRTASLTSNESVQSEGSFSVRRPPAAARWSQQRGRRHWMHSNTSAYNVRHRSYASMSSWYTDTIHE